MWVLLILLLVGLGIALSQLKRAPETARPLSVVLAAVTLVVVAVLVVFRGGNEDNSVRAFHEAAGFMMGQRIISDLGSTGTVVVVAPDFKTAFPNEAAVGVMSGMNEAMRETGRSANVFLFDGERVSQGPRPIISGDILQEARGGYSHADSIVFLMSCPEDVLAPEDAEAADEGPKVYAIGLSNWAQSDTDPPPGYAGVATFHMEADWKDVPAAGTPHEDVFAMRYRMLPP